MFFYIWINIYHNYLLTLGVIVALPSILLVIKPDESVVVKSQTYRPSERAPVTASVNAIEQVPSVALTFAVVKDVDEVARCVFLNVAVIVSFDKSTTVPVESFTVSVSV